MNLSTRPPEMRRSTRPPGLLETDSPGRNDLCRSDWRFLLPRLQYESLLFLGAPSRSTLGVIAGMARRVTIATDASHTLQRLEAEVHASRYDHVRLLRADPSRPLPIPGGTLESIVARGVEASRLVRSRTCVAELSRLLGSGGCVYIETERLVDALLLRAHLRRLRKRGFAKSRFLLPVRWKGLLRLAIPPDDDAIARYCFEHVVAGASRRGRRLQKIAGLPVRWHLLPYLTPRRILLLERPRRAERPGEPEHEAGATAYGKWPGQPRTVSVPPTYWQAPLQPFGAGNPAGRTALYARSDDDDNKVILLVFGRSARPEVVLKLPRSPRYNGRLEHEHDCLTLLHERGIVAPGSYPVPLFLDRHAGLVIHGQTMLHGRAFRNITTCRVDCPHLADGVDWITRLGEASAERVPVGGDDLGDWLPNLLRRFLQLYPVSDAEVEFLHARIDALRQAAPTLPRVFQHGDAGTANAVIDEEGRIGFFDWEDGNPRGLPLWDLFSFLLCFATWSGRVRGSRDEALAFERSFIEPSPLGRFQAEVVTHYCDRVGVDRHLIEPLYFVHLLGRSLRSGVRAGHAPGRVPDFRPLRLAIRHRNARGLACMLT